MARFVHYGHDMTDIPSTEEMLGLIASLEAALPDGSTRIGEDYDTAPNRATGA